MIFVLRMAMRELRASWRRLLFFFVCVAIGVGAIVALRSIVQNVRNGLTREARSLIAADVLVQTNRPWNPNTRERLESQLAELPIVDRTESIETATMVRPQDGAAVARMVELRAVQDKFPFYGQIVLDGGRTFSHDLLRGHGVLVRPELLTQLDVKEGEAVVIGGQPFTIRGVIRQEPGRRAGAFSLGSRVMVDYGDLIGTGLLSFGSRGSYQVLLRVREPDVERVARDLRRNLRDDFVNVRSFRSTEDQIGEDLQRAENYLSLVGFVIVVLGGIGVWSVTRVFVRQKIRSVAILKCVGATTRQVLATYVLQVLLLGLSGSALGVLLAGLGLSAIPKSVTDAFGGLPYGLTASAVVQGMGVGLMVSLLFALVPLLEVRHVKPLLLIRGLAPAAVTRWSWRAIDWTSIITAVAVSVALVALASWQAASLRVGLVVSIGFAGVALVLHLAGMGLVRAVRPLASASWFPLRHAVNGLRRPGNQTRVILLAVGLGSFFVLGIRALESNLLSQFSFQLKRGGADMFLIDIQEDQVPGMRTFLGQRAGSYALIPVLRARVTAVKGRDINLDTYQDVRGRGSLAREYTITYRDHLEANERLLQGNFWNGQPALSADAAELEVSIEKSIHERFRINIGDRMRFDILGRSIQARVTSVREVNWEDSRNGGFMFVFRPGQLEHAPHWYIGALRAPEDQLERARFQRDLVAGFPNVSAIDVREVFATIQRVLDNVTLAISIVGGVALASGALILIGAVAMTKFQRVYEAAILRTLGASTRLLAAMLALEYSALGLLAGIIGAAGALALSWAVCRFVFEIDWHPAPLVLTAGAVLTALLVGTIGVVASADVLRKKPLATLRAE
ncbi:MAG TPA: FtsX-like permease family protein [Vicinamibacterales bacterium]|jgi:putative ABC transport system permease protein|nr:FtsX-like permease family protein [Vicinamibacterales bacterium]